MPTVRCLEWDSWTTDPSWMYPTTVVIALSLLVSFPGLRLEDECPHLHTAAFGSVLGLLPPLDTHYARADTYGIILALKKHPGYRVTVVKWLGL